MKRSTRPSLVALILMLTMACSLRLENIFQQIAREGQFRFDEEVAKELERGVIYVTPLMTLTPTSTPTLTPTLTLSDSGREGPDVQRGPGGNSESSGSGGSGSGGPTGGPPPAGAPSPVGSPTVPPTLVPTLPPTVVPTNTPSPVPTPTEVPIPPPPPPPPPGGDSDDDDDDNSNPPPPLSVAFRSASYTVDEFDSFVVIEVVLNQTAAQTVTVLYAALDDTATSPDDYSSSGSGQLTFPPGVTSQSFNVDIVNDMDVEGPEMVQLLIGSQINANLGTPNEASLTIVDDDFPGVQFSSPNYTATEASGSAIITVTLTSMAPYVVTVDYATSDGTAAAGSDYTTAGDRLIFDPNVTARSFSVPVLTDAVIETDETVNLALISPDKAILGSPATAVLTILDSTLAQLTVTTSCGSNLAPASNGDGTRVIFESPCDPLGTNADGNPEIFLFDTTTGTLSQLTVSVSCDNLFATINDNGTRIAFESTCDPFGTNTDFNSELMLLDIPTNTLTQLIVTSDCFNEETSINAGGTWIAFRSFCNPEGNNADFSDEIFLFDTSTSTVFQLTLSGGCLNTEPSISADGTRIAFDSNCDLVGNNGDFNFEIFLFDTSTNTTTQLTTTSGCQNIAPSISDDGTQVALRTDCDPGSNPDRNFEIGLVDTGGGPLTMLTETDTPVECSNFSPVSNIDGTRVAFYSGCDPLGTNNDGNSEIFLFDAGMLRQITQTVGCGNQAPAIDNSGTRITYTSDCDPLGTNGDGNFEIFQAILN